MGHRYSRLQSGGDVVEVVCVMFVCVYGVVVCADVLCDR